MAFLRIENVSKNFGAFTALKDISFEAEAGEFVVLLGPSGCGKSTLLRLITGLTEDHDGEIFIDGRRVTDLDPKDRRVAMVFQSYALYPHLTVARNISFGMEINHVGKAERDRRVLEAAKALQLETLLARYPAELSGGQRQRVAIGRCLVREPDLFLFDEPLSNLDAKLRQETRAELKHLHQRLGATTVYVTHDQYEAMTLASKVVLLDRGEIVQIGTPMELYNHPVNRFAATFIGTPEINLIRGRLETSGAARRFVADGMPLDLPPGIFSAAPGDGEAEFAIRPESVRLASAEEAHCTVTVDYAEPTGSDIFVNGSIGRQPVIVRVERETTVAPGDRLPIRWQLDAASLFDVKTGNRL
jgi:multiple sugar transport system ATP-binding protein